MKIRVLLFLLVSVAFAKSQAQGLDSTRLLSPVEIKADRISVFSSGIKIEQVDSVALAIRQTANLSAFLSELSPVTLRSYGPAGTASLSMRGTTSSQSGVFWNGINLQQPNMAITDLSRISTFEFSDVGIQSGGASSLLGSGVIGGSLQLSNTLKFSSPARVTAMLGMGSFGNTNAGLKVSTGAKKLAYTGSLTGSWHQNNFKYTDFYGNRVALDHALVKSVSSVHQFEYLLNAHQKIKAGFWYQASARQIPPTMTMNASDQQQWDNAIRSSIQWMYTGTNQSITIRTAYIDEHERYKSKLSNIDAHYHLSTYQSDIEYKRYLGKRFVFGGGVTSHIIRADVPYYRGIEYQPEGSVWTALSYAAANKGLTAAINLRQDFSKGYTIPICPSMSAEVPLNKNISLHAAVSRNFRIPTTNDKYWVPGGNPDLKPENSWNLETGSTFLLQRNQLLSSRITVDVYSLLVDNMIQWMPGNAGVWSPQNVQKVWSRGVEIASRSDWKYAGFKGYFRFGYNYTPSTNRATSSSQPETDNKQLIYIPLHKIQETFYVKKDALYAMFTYTFTGKRFVLSDNSVAMPAYTLFDFYAGTTFKSKKISFSLQGEIHNVLNTNYQSIQYYPEAGRSFAVNIIITR